MVRNTPHKGHTTMETSLYKLIYRDQTQHWNMPEVTKVARIFDVFLVNWDEKTHICSLTPSSYHLHMGRHLETTSENIDSDDYEYLQDMVLDVPEYEHGTYYDWNETQKLPEYESICDNPPNNFCISLGSFETEGEAIDYCNGEGYYF